MEGQAAVGRRVRVFWEGEGEWFEGVVDEFDPESGYFVRYDDGEEQWETAAERIEFLPSQSDDAAKDEPAMPSPTYSQHEFEDDGGSERDDGQSGGGDDRNDQGETSETELRPHDEPDTSPSSSGSTRSGSGHQQQQHTTARALKGSGAPFFRDQESLKEMKRALEADKRELAQAKASLEAQLAGQERESAAVRRELQQLKTQVSLASALQYSRSSTSKQRKPASSIEWKQRVLDLKLDNQQLQYEVEKLKTAAQTQQKDIGEQQKLVEQLRAKVDRIPKRELLTLVELQIEIAQLLQRKRELQAMVAACANASDLKTKQPPRHGQNAEEERRTALEKELARLERSLTQSQEDARSWRTRMECERARLQPMRERLESLRAELVARYDTDSGDHRSVLLRSLFLRLVADGDAAVDEKAAHEAFALLLGRFADATTTESTPAHDGDNRLLTFDQFVETYRRVSCPPEAQ